VFDQTFKNIDDLLWKDAGCTSELDYTEQTSWLLFLKYLDALEKDKAAEATLEGKKYSYILDKPYRWEAWASPKGKDGKIDHNTAFIGDDLIKLVNQKLFPYIYAFKQKATVPNTIEYKNGEIFGEIINRIQSSYNLREIIDHIDAPRFGSQSKSTKWEFSTKRKSNACGTPVETVANTTPCDLSFEPSFQSSLLRLGKRFTMALLALRASIARPLTISNGLS
jgi:hypothetical protein